tara:strand:- start:241649 stop:242851 length:1203 start_codon:yes stop_codon:yes gene_type:complete
MFLHVDMDAFYASIEQRDRPELRGKPVVVGGSSGRGVVAAASYEARRFGIHSAIPGRRAAQLCPEAVFVKSRINHYADVGRQVREIFHRFTPLVQPLSLDEAFLDVAGSLRLYGDAEKIGRMIKSAITDELNLTASVGVAPLKFVAKIASDLNKPDGFLVVGKDQILTFLDPLPIKRLWGVGRVGQEKLQRIGIHHVGDIRARTSDDMRRHFGGWGEHLWRLANGIDPRKVVPDHTAKQISHERTFAEDIADEELLRGVVCALCEQLTRRLRRSERQARNVSIKYRREDFRTFSRSTTLKEMSDETETIFQAASELLSAMRRDQPRPVRLIGVSVGSLTDRNPMKQLGLFDDVGGGTDGQRNGKKLDNVVDDIANKIGPSALYRASGHVWKNGGRGGREG